MKFYKKLYFQLFNDVTDAIEKLKQAMINSEETYAEGDDEFFADILKKVKASVAADEEKRKRKASFTSYDPSIHKNYLFVYEPFIPGKHKDLEPEYEAYFKKFLAGDEEILQHFITVKKEIYALVEHLFFTNKQVIVFTPKNECAIYDGINFMQFISYPNIVYHAFVGGPSERKDTPLGIEFQIRNADLRFIDFLTEQHTIDLNNLINSHM